MRAQLTAATTSVQGVGWGALAWDPMGQRLMIEQIYDHQGNIGQAATPLLVIDALGARVLPAVQERARRLGRGLLEHRQLDATSRAASSRPAACSSSRRPELRRSARISIDAVDAYAHDRQ